MNPPNNGLTAIKDLFAFPFRDPRWKTKLLVGAGLTLAGTVVPIIPILPVLGYGARITRRAAAEQVTRPALEPAELAEEGDAPLPIAASVLPEWDNWDELFMDGLRQFGVGVLINLPLLLLFILGFGVYFGIQFSVILSQAHRANPGAFPILMLVAMGVMFLTTGLSIILVPLTYLLLPPASAHVAVNRRFSALFQFKFWFHALRSNLGGYLAFLFFLAGLYVVFVIIMQAFYLTLILCCLLPVISSLVGFYMMILFFNGSGLAYAGGSIS